MNQATITIDESNTFFWTSSNEQVSLELGSQLFEILENLRQLHPWPEQEGELERCKAEVLSIVEGLQG